MHRKQEPPPSFSREQLVCRLLRNKLPFQLQASLSTPSAQTDSPSCMCWWPATHVSNSKLPSSSTHMDCSPLSSEHIFQRSHRCHPFPFFFPCMGLPKKKQQGLFLLLPPSLGVPVSLSRPVHGLSIFLRTHTLYCRAATSPLLSPAP